MIHSSAASALVAFSLGTADPLTARAYEMWLRAIKDARFTRLVAGAYFGADSIGDVPKLGCGRGFTAWPGWQGWPGVARAEFDGKGRWQEAPLDSIGSGRLVVTLPIGAYVTERVIVDDDPPVDLAVMAPRFVAFDIIACDPIEPGIWGRLTGHADLMGEGLLSVATLAAANDVGRPLRLHRHPLDWWRAGNGAAVAGAGCCILAKRAWRRDDVLATSWICDDELHAAEVAERQKRARAALMSERIPQAGALAFVSRPRAAASGAR